MRKIAIGISVIVVAVLFVVAAVLFFGKDKTGPEIIVDESKLAKYHAEIAKKDLLQGVTAIDDKDGDVSDSLMVESVEAVEGSSEVEVTYVATDHRKNVTKFVQIFSTDASVPADSSLEVSEEMTEEVPEEVTDETESIGTQDLESDTETALAALPPEVPRFYLKEYQLTLNVGDSFSRLDWVEDITDDEDDRNSLYRDIRIDGEVDVNTPGTYELTYYAVDSDGNRSNDAVLTVTVQAP